MAEQFHVRQLFGLNLHAELFLHDDHDVHKVQAVDADVLFQTGFGFDVVAVQLQFFYQEVFDGFFNFLYGYIIVELFNC